MSVFNFQIVFNMCCKKCGGSGKVLPKSEPTTVINYNLQERRIDVELAILPLVNCNCVEFWPRIISQMEH